MRCADRLYSLARATSPRLCSSSSLSSNHRSSNVSCCRKRRFSPRSIDSGCWLASGAGTETLTNSGGDFVLSVSGSVGFATSTCLSVRSRLWRMLGLSIFVSFCNTVLSPSGYRLSNGLVPVTTGFSICLSLSSNSS